MLINSAPKMVPTETSNPLKAGPTSLSHSPSTLHLGYRQSHPAQVDLSLQEGPQESVFETHHREFPGGPVVRTQRFYCQSPDSIPGQGTNIPQAM